MSKGYPYILNLVHLKPETVRGGVSTTIWAAVNTHLKDKQGRVLFVGTTEENAKVAVKVCADNGVVARVTPVGLKKFMEMTAPEVTAEYSMVAVDILPDALKVHPSVAANKENKDILCTKLMNIALTGDLENLRSSYVLTTVWDERIIQRCPGFTGHGATGDFSSGEGYAPTPYNLYRHNEYGYLVHAVQIEEAAISRWSEKPTPGMYSVYITPESKHRPFHVTAIDRSQRGVRIPKGWEQATVDLADLMPGNFLLMAWDMQEGQHPKWSGQRAAVSETEFKTHFTRV